MPSISNPTLTVDPVEGHPGQRRVRVAYDVTCDTSDPMVGRALVAHIVVHAVDLHDAAIRPRQRPVVAAEETFVVDAGTDRRCLDRIVDRVDLDVEQDWWSAGQSGETRAIAEWLDHLVADIGIDIGGEVVAKATTPVLTGSWGALGDD